MEPSGHTGTSVPASFGGERTPRKKERKKEREGEEKERGN